MTNSVEFPLREDLVYLNHASYGVPTVETLRVQQQVRDEIEKDTAYFYSDRLEAEARRNLQSLLDTFELPDVGEYTLTANATEGANAFFSSALKTHEDGVAYFSTEYSSVIQTVEEKCAAIGAQTVQIPVDLPADKEGIVAAVRDLPSEVRFLLASLVSSSHAITFPIDDLADACKELRITLVVDASHCLGLVPWPRLHPSISCIFGSVHKWLPTARGVGILWARTPDSIRPATVALRRDESTLLGRFCWRGTWDPSAWLTVESATMQYREWSERGLLAEAEDRANALATGLARRGCTPTQRIDRSNPRMMCFQVPGVTKGELKKRLYDGGLRAWIGADAPNGSLLRFATHIYTTDADVERFFKHIDTIVHARRNKG